MLHVFRLMLYVMLQETLQHYKKRVQHYTRPRPPSAEYTNPVFSYWEIMDHRLYAV